MSAGSSSAELLVVILDARVAALKDLPPKHPHKHSSYNASAGGLDLNSPPPLLPLLWDAVRVLCRAHATLAQDQRLAFLGAGASRADVLFSGACEEVDWSAARTALADFVLAEGGGTNGQQVLISTALSRALCYVSRTRQDIDNQDFPARVLVISAPSGTADLAGQGTSLTSSAFAAKSAGVPVDCLSLSSSPSALIRQVAILTGGKHHALSAGGQHAISEVLTPSLLFHFVAGVHAREQLNVTEDIQNLAAVCSCHGEAREIAYVCSCCLAVYCSGTRAICTTCRTRFRQDHAMDPQLLELDVSSMLRR